MVRMTQWMGMLVLASLSVGCAQFFDGLDSYCFRWQCEHRAKAAWMEVRDLYGDVSYPYNFSEGFRAGYKAVCMGDDNGCAPPFPPRRYWSSCYLNCEGKAKAMAWYDGYAHGVLAASCSGCGDHCQVYTGAVGHGSGEMGSALKGYRPPMPNQYRPDQYGPDANQFDGGPLDQYEPQPTPFRAPSLPPAGGQPPAELLPSDETPLAPEPPAIPAAPSQTRRNRPAPQIPAAEVYRVPVF